MDVRDERTAGTVRAWLAAIVESSDDAIIGKDLNRVIISWNKGAERMYGYTADEAIGRPVSILMPPGQHDEAVDILERIKRGERVDHYETRRMRKDGTILEVSLTVSPVFDADGRVIGASKIARDITLRKQAERLQAQLAAIVESSDDAIIGKDLNGIITSWNKGAERMYGYMAQELVGQPITMLLPADHQDELPYILERLRRGERIEHFETRRRCKDGRILDVSLTISPIYDAAGHIMGASKIARDITERKQDEERTTRMQAIAGALSEALTVEQVADVILRQGSSAVGAAAVSIVLLADNDTILEVAYATGYPEAVVEHWPRFSVDTVVPLADTVRTGQPVWLPTPEARNTAYPGLASSELEYQAWAALPLVIKSRPIGAIDLSFIGPQAFADKDRMFMLTLSGLCAQALERARLYEGERNARVQAELATQSKNRFLANLSHDLRTPLNSIMGMAQVLLLQAIGPLNERQTEAANDILSGGQYLLSLLNHALDLSRNEDGQLKLQLAQVELTRLIHNSVVLIQQEALARKIAVETEIDADLPIVHADEHRITQVLANLLSNAVKFTPDGGRVGVRASCLANRLRFEVWDTGIGIAPENQPLLFQPFERLEHVEAMRRYEGTGLGLALSKQLIDLHGGEIGVASDGEGRGATFWFTLPVQNKA